VQYESRMDYAGSAKPLDFSFMYIKNVASKFSSQPSFNHWSGRRRPPAVAVLRKEHARDGKRKDPIHSEDEEEIKKVSESANDLTSAGWTERERRGPSE